MVDIHSHILWELDDGSKNIFSSVDMAKQAVAEGITSVIATPHHRHPSYTNEKKNVLIRVKDLQSELKRQNIPLNIYAGQEIRLFGEMLDAFNHSEELLTLNNSEYILVEFPPSNIPKYTEQLFYDLLVKGYTPIIAHPERNAAIAENTDKLYRLIKNGALSQVTAASVAGKFGRKTQKLSLNLLEHHLAHFVASDAHNMTNRSFVWKQGMDKLKKELGSDMVTLVNTQAEDVLQGRSFKKLAPERFQQRKKLFGLV
ncbi:tyrosine-protein phosphatase [Paenisporosarcina sp. TG-14]|uniref:tyrosine-protein phosphatase n=1 Tax=Paenisporosarcina sp. TG-14 TaxID=1231057 RepID=UPI000317B1CC|nr:CpsB/CapC family capsule biosynthesis tyrosine phosphatase [Paenisporosarcina sp. TG-14]